MKTQAEKNIDDLEKEWQEIAERIKEIESPELKRINTTNYAVLRRMIIHQPGLRAEIERRIPELTKHPFISLPTADLETFSVAHPQAGPDKYLCISHASYINAGTSAHFSNGTAVFHPKMMGSLVPTVLGMVQPQEYPGVELWYLFPDDTQVLSYEIRFQVFLYNQTNNVGANFLLSKTEWGHAENIIRTQHINLPGPYEEDTFRYLSIRVNATGVNGVNGKRMIFKIKHDDWDDSNTNWWFYSVKVTKTYFG